MLTNPFRARDRAPAPDCAQPVTHVTPTAIEALAHGTLADRPTFRRDTDGGHYTRVRLIVSGTGVANIAPGAPRVRMVSHGDAADVVLRVIAYEAAPRAALRNLRQGARVTVVGPLQMAPDGLAIIARDIVSLSTERNTP